jgi:hypothetical protein
MFDPYDHYELVNISGKYNNDWVVIRKKDNKVMTQGALLTMCKWLHVWGPMRQND